MYCHTWASVSGARCSMREHAATQTSADVFVAAREQRSWRGLNFGGVAFKYSAKSPA